MYWKRKREVNVVKISYVKESIGIHLYRWIHLRCIQLYRCNCNYLGC